jgi:hypothetical protein
VRSFPAQALVLGSKRAIRLRLWLARRKRKAQGDPPAKYHTPPPVRELKAQKRETAFVGVGGAEVFAVVNWRAAFLSPPKGRGIRTATLVSGTVTLQFLAE